MTRTTHRNWLTCLVVALSLTLPAAALAQDKGSGKMAGGEEATDDEPSAEAGSGKMADTEGDEDGGSGKMADDAEEGDAEGGETATSELPTPDASGSQTYDMRVRELEEKVNDLKEKIFRSKSRLVLLKETVLRGSISGSKAVLVHKNEMGNSFKLEQAIYSLDGNQIYNKIDQEGDLADKEKFEIFNGAIVPGNHNISVMLVYRGNGFGVFSYLQGYKFTIRSSYTFTAEEGKTTQVRIIGYEKGGVTTALEDRPDVRYEIEFFDDTQKASSAK